MAVGLVLWMAGTAQAAEAPKPCEAVETKGVKVEGYISKKFKKQKRAIIKEFGEMGSTRTAIRPYPIGETAKVIGIGRCVPAYIARHVNRYFYHTPDRGGFTLPVVSESP